MNPKLRIKYRFIHFHVRVGRHSEAAATIKTGRVPQSFAAVMSCDENSRGLDVDQFDMMFCWMLIMFGELLLYRYRLG